MKRSILTAILLASVMGVGSAQDVKREITQVTDDVYRFQNRFHVNMFVLTGDGVVVTDPINDDAAAWLRTEIGTLTGQPITDLIYSHSHGDHASGGEGYGEIANIVAQQNAPAVIDGVKPTIRFSDRMSFTRGDKTFELTYLGPGHGNDLIAIVVRPDNVAFVVDAVSSKRLFYRDFPGANLDQWIEQVRKIDSLEFEVMIGGHGPVGVKSDVGAGIAYLKSSRDSRRASQSMN
jgi:glyoxylase-like metal-dependent hydrolase (beta-lactamase superfamily II)